MDKMPRRAYQCRFAITYEPKEECASYNKKYNDLCVATNKPCDAIECAVISIDRLNEVSIELNRIREIATDIKDMKQSIVITNTISYIRDLLKDVE